MRVGECSISFVVNTVLPDPLGPAMMAVKGCLKFISDMILNSRLFILDQARLRRDGSLFYYNFATIYARPITPSACGSSTPTAAPLRAARAAAAAVPEHPRLTLFVICFCV